MEASRPDGTIGNPNHNPNHDPSTDVIPRSASLDCVIIDEPEVVTTNIDELLKEYKVNQSKLVKVEHHIKHLEESLKQLKIPRGLQINQECQVIDETEDFRIHIREIQLNAEIEIVNVILDHYRPIFKKLWTRINYSLANWKNFLPQHPISRKKPSQSTNPS